MNLKKLQELIDQFIDGTNQLARGPLKYISKLGPIAHGAFRRDYLTLETIYLLSKKPPERFTVFGNSCMDLFRRTFEDMIALEYMSFKGKDNMADKFMAFKAVEAMRDISYLKKAGYPIDPKFEKEIIEDFEKVRKRFEDKRSPDGVRRTWAGVDIEIMVQELLTAGVIKADKSRVLLQTYQASCYKNHFSPTDIHAFLNDKLFEFSNKTDMEQSMLFTLSSVTKIAARLITESEADLKGKQTVERTWKTLLNAHKTKILD